MHKAVEAARERLVGLKIEDVKVAKCDDWCELEIYLDDGSIIIPMADMEGNGPGVLLQLIPDEESPITVGPWE